MRIGRGRVAGCDRRVRRRYGAGGYGFYGGIGVYAKADQVGHERSYFKGHFLAFGYGAYRFALDEFEFVRPRVHFDAPSDGESGDQLRILFLVDGSCGLEVRDNRDAVAKMRADEIGNFLLARFHGGEEEAGVAELILVGRVVQELNGFRAGGMFLVLRALESEMAESIFFVDDNLIEEGIARLGRTLTRRVKNGGDSRVGASSAKVRQRR